MASIGIRIIELVKERGMTQKEFSEKTGIPQSTISDWRDFFGFLTGSFWICRMI